MICPYCGAENGDNFQFCQNCGAKVTARHAAPAQQVPYVQNPQQVYAPPQEPGYAPQQTAVPPKAKKAPKLHIDFKKYLPKEPKKLLIPGAAALAVLVVVILLISLFAGGGNAGFDVRKNNNMFYYDQDAEERLLFQDGKLLEEGLDFSISRSLYSMDGSVMAVVTDEDELYVIRGGAISLVAEEVDSFVLSLNGNTLACINEDEELTVYNTKSLEGTMIGEEVAIVCLSPDGKTVAYCTMDEDYNATAWLYQGKDSVELTDDLAPFAVSNGGKLIYCIHPEKEALYIVNKKGEDTKIASEMDDTDIVYMNRDHTEMLFFSDGKWYITEDGGDKVKVHSKSDVFAPCHPYFHGSIYNAGIQTVAVDSLAGHFYLGGDTLYYMDKKWETEKVDGDIYSGKIAVTQDGESVFFIRDDNTLYTARSKDPGDPEELAEEVESFVITPDGEAVYFLDMEQTLWYQKGTKEPKRIGDDVSTLSMTRDGWCLFLTDYSNNSGTLYASRNGSKREQLFSDCYRVIPTSSATYLYTDYSQRNSTYSLFAATKGTKFEALFEP